MNEPSMLKTKKHFHATGVKRMPLHISIFRGMKYVTWKIWLKNALSFCFEFNIMHNHTVLKCGEWWTGRVLTKVLPMWYLYLHYMSIKFIRLNRTLLWPTKPNQCYWFFSKIYFDDFSSASPIESSCKYISWNGMSANIWPPSSSLLSPVAKLVPF